jgi:HK97 family phage prohead protease
MELPADLFFKPVPGDDELLAFRYDFALDEKALPEGQQTVTVEENGDLIIEGYAAVFAGMDRQNENFTDGAFKRGIKSFLEGQAGLCYHHKHDKLLGKVLDLREEEGKGLKMRARVDGAIRKHPELGTYYEQIKNGSLNALSVGGFFRRKLTEAGKKIVDMDFTEISVTPVPVHPGTNFAVVAGKALTSDLRVPDNVNVDLPDGEIRDEDFESLQYALELLGRIHKNVEGRSSAD